MSAGPSHEVTLQRFKLLHLVQQVAKEDVAELVRTVGIEALTYRGTGVRSVGMDGAHGNPTAARDAFVEHREHSRHVFRDFGPRPLSQPKAPRRQAGYDIPIPPRPSTAAPWKDSDRTRYVHTETAGDRDLPRHRQHVEVDNERADGRHLVRSPVRSRPEHRQQPSVALNPRTQVTEDDDDEVHYCDAPQQPNRQAQEGQNASHHFPTRAPQASGSQPHHNHPAAARVHFSMNNDAISGTPAAVSSQQILSASDRSPSPTSVPKDIIALAAQMLARSSSRSSRRTSTQVTPTKLPRRHDGDVEGNSAPEIVKQRVGAYNDAAVDARVHLVTTATNTPPPKRATTADTQTIGDAMPPILDLGQRERNSAGQQTQQTQVPPPAAHNEGSRSVALSLRSTEPVAPPSADGGDKQWLFEALSVLDNVVDEQEQMDARWRRVEMGGQIVTRHGDDFTAATRSPSQHQLHTVDNDTLAMLTLGRTARAVDTMIENASRVEQARLSNTNDDDPNRSSSSRRHTSQRTTRERQPLPPGVVSRLLEFRNDEIQCVRHNERLWNTSHVSQYTFADRLTSSLLSDLLDEVLDEVSTAMDDYVEGLAEHELQ